MDSTLKCKWMIWQWTLARERTLAYALLAIGWARLQDMGSQAMDEADYPMSVPLDACERN